MRADTAASNKVRSLDNNWATSTNSNNVTSYDKIDHLKSIIQKSKQSKQSMNLLAKNTNKNTGYLAQQLENATNEFNGD